MSQSLKTETLTSIQRKVEADDGVIFKCHFESLL